MRVSLKTIISSALLTTLVGGLSSSATAAPLFEPFGEGVLPSGKYVENFRFTIHHGETVPWHYHPGKIYGVIVSGTLTEDKGCGQPVSTITSGSAFSETAGAIHRVFNYGNEDVVIIFTFIVPPSYAGYTGTIFINGPRCDDDD
jgi:quercetin dioxygenase-like cupin family protein